MSTEASRLVALALQECYNQLGQAIGLRAARAVTSHGPGPTLLTALRYHLRSSIHELLSLYDIIFEPGSETGLQAQS